MIDNIFAMCYLIHIIALKYCRSTLRLPVEAWGMLRVDTERRSEVRRRTYQISLKKQSEGANGSS